MTPSIDAEHGATVVISHRVRDGQLAAYEKWLGEIGPVCKTYPGHLDLQIIRPVKGLTATYTVIIRFDSREHLEEWMNSDDRRRLLERVRSRLARRDDFFVRSGLDFWFAPEGARARVPTRWKQFLITWSAIYPLVLVIPLPVRAVMHEFRIPENRYLTTLSVTCVIGLLMVYVIMPRYTKLLQKWLFD